MTDNAPSSHGYGVGGFGNGAVTPGYNGIGDQGRPCSDYSQYGTQYPHYGQRNVRPGYSMGPVVQKEGMIPSRHGMSWSSNSTFQSNCPPGQHARYLPSGGLHGSHQSQLPGSSPTLNQLLQSPTNDERYTGMYGEFGSSSHPKTSGPEDGIQSGYGGPQSGWTAQQRMAAGGYQQQQILSSTATPQTSPNQSVGMYDVSRRPSVGMGSRYPPPPPPHQSHGPSIQNASQHLANSQPNLSAMNQLCGQMQPGFSPPNHSLPIASHLQPSPSTTPLSQHSDHSSSNLKAQSSPQSAPTSKQKTKKQQKRQQQTKPQKNVQENCPADDAESSALLHGTAGNASSQHAGGAQLQNPVPSPVGSVSSRSNTPASLSGNVVGSPSGNQHDGQNRILSPFHSQGGGSGVGSGNILNWQQQQQQQQMMPPPSMFPSHAAGMSPGSSKVLHVPLPPPSPQVNLMGSSQQMAAQPYNSGHYNNAHYGGSRGSSPAGSHSVNMIIGYSGGHPDLMNGPSSHLPGYGPGGMVNRAGGYHSLYSSNSMDSPAQFGVGYSMHPVGSSSLMVPASGAITSSAAEAGFHSTAPTAEENSEVNGKSSTSTEEGHFSSRPLFSTTEAHMTNNQSVAPAVGTSIGGRLPYPSGGDGGLGRNTYGMPPPYEIAGLGQQQQQHQQHMLMGFAKSFPGMAVHPGQGAFLRDTAPGAPGDERSRPSSGSMDSNDPIAIRLNSVVGMGAGDSNTFLKRPYDVMSFHGNGPLAHHYPPNHPVYNASSHGLPDDPVVRGHHVEPHSSGDSLPPLPRNHTNMGPPSSSHYMAGDQAVMFDGGELPENRLHFSAAGASSGFIRDKWNKSDYSHPSDNVVRNCITDRDKPRIYDEGSTSDTQSSDFGMISQTADDSSRLSGNLGHETFPSSNGSALLKSHQDDGKKSKSGKSKKQKAEKVSGLVVPSPMTPDVPDDFSNASRPATPKSEGNDILNKLAEMGDEPDRRSFLERLFAFMEENGTPIVSIPMISKTAIDLYKLYHLVREQGGMVELTKNKKWRDVSAALNIGPSSSAGFTLKKNYGKHLFAFECRFDRGNIDPAPILAMLEQPTKKESKKAAAERAAAAAVNTQDMYRMSSGQQFGCYPGGNVHVPPGLDPGSHPMLMSSPGVLPQQMPYGGTGIMHPSGMVGPVGNMPNGSMIHPGMEGDLPFPPGMGTMGGGSSLMPPNNGGDTINIQDPFSDVPSQSLGALHRPNMNYMVPGGGGGNAVGMMMHRGPYGGAGNVLDGRSQKLSFGSASANKSPLSPPMAGAGVVASESGQGDQADGLSRMAPDGASISQDGFSSYNNRGPPDSGSSSSQRPPVEPMHMTPSRRFEPQQPQPMVTGGIHSLQHEEQGHPDSGYYGSRQAAVQQRSMMDSQIAFSHGGYPGGYQSNQRILPPHLGSGDRYCPPGAAGSAVDSAGQMMYMGSPPGMPPSRQDMLTPSPHRPSMMKTEHKDGYHPCYDGRKDHHWMPSSGMTPNYPLSYTPNTMLHGIPQPPNFSHSNQMGISPLKLDRSSCPQLDRKLPSVSSRSDINFPVDSVEAMQPPTTKRKRYTHKQLGSVDPWRLMMSLKSGLIAESTSALEILSILLHDDATVVWFGLQHLPGLIEVLLEHFRRCLTHIFPNNFDDLELGFELLESISCNKSDSEGKNEDNDEESKVCSLHDKLDLLEGNNIIMKPRNGDGVTVEENLTEQKLILDSKKWDVYQEIDSSLFDWQMGRGDTTIHVQAHFAPESSAEFCTERFFGKKQMPHLTDKKNYETDSCLLTGDEEKTTLLGGYKQEVEDTDTPAKCEVNEKKEDGQLIDNVKKEDLDVTDRCSAYQLDNKVEACRKTAEAGMGDDVRALESMKRKWTEDEDVEVYQHDDQSLFLVSESQIEISRRCLCVSNIFRSLSFVPSNDCEMSKHPGLLLVLGKLLMLNHTHIKPSHSNQMINKVTPGEDKGEVLVGCDASARWSTEALKALREDTFVILANISGQLDLSMFPEEIVSPILNGLLHWVTCTAACAHDPLPTMPSQISLSPRRLVLETLCKLCIADSNVDLLLAMPPYSRTVLFLSNLVQLVAESGDQVVREFAIVLISSLVQADSSAARAIALHRPSISILLDFIESADHRAVHVVNTQGLAMLKDSPDMMGTSLDMLRRAALVLCHMAEVPENKTIFARYHHRLLQLVMSQIMDQKVATILAEVIYHSSLS